MFTVRRSSHHRVQPVRHLVVTVAGLIAAIVLAAAAATPASAQVYRRAPNTVYNFCHFNPGLGQIYFGRAAGRGYAAWDIFNGNQFNYYALDLNGDHHVDTVVYAPRQLTIVDIGFCTGRMRNVWYSAQRIEQASQQASQQASNGSGGTRASSCAATPGCSLMWETQLFDGSSGLGSLGSLSGIVTNPETGNPDGM